MNPRIITGKYKGNKVKVPLVSRPVTDRVKTYVFDKIKTIILGAKVLDLFCGSGNLGLESLSRGASHVTFVDRDSSSIEAVLENIRKFRINEEEYTVVKKDYKKFLEENLEDFEIIFIDPPFVLITASFIKRLIPYLKKGALVILKTEKKSDLSTLEDIRIIEVKDIGINKIYFISI